jgi:hypothetical protein
VEKVEENLLAEINYCWDSLREEEVLLSRIVWMKSFYELIITAKISSQNPFPGALRN